MIQDTTLNDKFLYDGFVILRGVVPANRLESLQKSYDRIVDRARQQDPTWDTTATARTNVAPYLDKETIEALEFALHENTFGTTAQVLDRDAEEIALASVSVLCNPEFEPTETPSSGQSWGTDPRNWHRDVRPDHDGPFRALLADELANGPSYAQWNIALYDDSIFHFIPGSHRRDASEAEEMQLQTDGGAQIPLSDCVCADLNPGDGIVYNSMLLHWGSKYTQQQKRRTIHLGYRTFGRILPHQRECRLPENVSNLLLANTPQRLKLEQGFALFHNEYTILQGIFRAVLDGDVAQFQTGLIRLHPESEGRLTCLILLSKIAQNVCRLSRERENEVDAEKSSSLEGVGIQQQIASTYTTADAEKLWERFRPLDDMLRAGEPTHVTGFLGSPTDYRFVELPVSMTVDGVISEIFG